jgi:hypothetical protein
MKYQLIWHGPVRDVEYEVEADSPEEAKLRLQLYLAGEDEEGIREL